MMTLGRSLAKWKIGSGFSDSPRIRRDELLIDDLDDLLAGIDGPQHLLADRPCANAFDELVDGVEVDVGFEQRGADVLQAFADIRFGDTAAAAQPFDGVLQPALNAIEHRWHPDMWQHRRNAAGNIEL